MLKTGGFFGLLPGPNAGGVLEEQSRLSAGEDSEIPAFFLARQTATFFYPMAKWPLESTV